MSTTVSQSIFTKDLVSPKTGNRILLGLLALTVAGSGFYIYSTDKMQQELDMKDRYTIHIKSRNLPEKVRAGKAKGLTYSQVVKQDYAAFKAEQTGSNK